MLWFKVFTLVVKRMHFFGQKCSFFTIYLSLTWSILSYLVLLRPNYSGTSPLGHLHSGDTKFGP